MKHVGFQGGSSIFELGSASDMICFFAVIRECVNLSEDELALLDRLFRKYLRLEDMNGAEDVMRKARDCLSRIPCHVSDMRRMGFASDATGLDSLRGNYADIFVKYFEGFEYCIESCRGFFEDWGVLKPVRTVVCDMPDYLVEKLRSLDEYEQLGSGDIPFWLR